MKDDKRSTLQYSQVPGPIPAFHALPYRSGGAKAGVKAREGEGAAPGAPAGGQVAHVDARKPGVLRVPPARQNAPRRPGNRPTVRRTTRQGGR
jgi:hypothetical protein